MKKLIIVLLLIGTQSFCFWDLLIQAGASLIGSNMDGNTSKLIADSQNLAKSNEELQKINDKLEAQNSLFKKFDTAYSAMNDGIKKTNELNDRILQAKNYWEQKLEDANSLINRFYNGQYTLEEFLKTAIIIEDFYEDYVFKHTEETDKAILGKEKISTVTEMEQAYKWENDADIEKMITIFNKKADYATVAELQKLKSDKHKIVELQKEIKTIKAKGKTNFETLKKALKAYNDEESKGSNANQKVLTELKKEIEVLTTNDIAYKKQLTEKIDLYIGKVNEYNNYAYKLTLKFNNQIAYYKQRENTAKLKKTYIKDIDSMDIKAMKAKFNQQVIDFFNGKWKASKIREGNVEYESYVAKSLYSRTYSSIKSSNKTIKNYGEIVREFEKMGVK